MLPIKSGGAEHSRKIVAPQGCKRSLIIEGVVLADEEGKLHPGVVAGKSTEHLFKSGQHTLRHELPGGVDVPMPQYPSKISRCGEEGKGSEGGRHWREPAAS